MTASYTQSRKSQSTAPSNEQPLLGLVNIGSTIARQLARLELYTVGDLRQAGGSATVYRQLQQLEPDRTWPKCYYLYALQGALDGMHWTALSEPQKRALRDEVRR